MMAISERPGGDRMATFARVRATDDPATPTARHAHLLDVVYVTDQPSLSLAATQFAWDSDVQADRLYSRERLEEWLELAGLPALSTTTSEGQLQQLRELRESVYRLARQRISGETPDPEHVAVVNAAAALPTAAPRLSAGGFERDAAAEGFAFPGLLSLLARNAIDVVAGPWSDRLRACERTPCTHMFVDRSPGGVRRWCTGAKCGNRVRAAEFRQRNGRAA